MPAGRVCWLHGARDFALLFVLLQLREQHFEVAKEKEEEGKEEKEEEEQEEKEEEVEEKEEEEAQLEATQKEAAQPA